MLKKHLGGSHRGKALVCGKFKSSFFIVMWWISISKNINLCSEFGQMLYSEQFFMFSSIYIEGTKTRLSIFLIVY